MPTVAIDGKELEITSDYASHGNIVINLDPSVVSGKIIEVNKPGGMPAWGGVISNYVAPINRVKSKGGANLRVEKALHVYSDDGTLRKANLSDLHVGDKVRVTLTVVCGKDMEYVALTDERSACMQPDQWISEYGAFDGLYGYRETRESKISFFIEFLPKGTYVISYDCNIDREGEYSLGIASVQSLYSPIEAAHSKGDNVKVVKK